MQNTSEPPLIRAARYVRMSTEHQQYSTENQADKILEYAVRHRIEIVRTYADEGKSGLNIGGREGLQRLLADVRAKNTDFEVILVYDVSRWGRFQDADESAHYEYMCKQAGIRVIYCAEQFENDGSPVSTIVKGVKRAMAGEYSRELSAKVFTGQCRLIELGFRQGGTAGFGLRRVLLDQSGTEKAALKIGEHKSLQTDRVVLRPGPPEEVETVQRMYRWFVEDGVNEVEIATRLNAAGIATDLGRPGIGASGADQREVYRPQRLQSHVLQTEAAACDQPAGTLGPQGRRLRRDRGAGTILHGPGHRAGPRPAVHRRRTAGTVDRKRCSDALV